MVTELPTLPLLGSAVTVASRVKVGAVSPQVASVLPAPSAQFTAPVCVARALTEKVPSAKTLPTPTKPVLIATLMPGTHYSVIKMLVMGKVKLDIHLVKKLLLKLTLMENGLVLKTLIHLHRFVIQCLLI